MKTEFPKAIKEGTLKLGELEMKVYVLENGERVIDENDVLKFLKYLEAGEITKEQAEQFANDLNEF